MNKITSATICFFLAWQLVWAVATVSAANSAGPTVSAEELVARMLTANRPWLELNPIHGSYALLRREGGASEGEVLGPLSFEGDSDPYSQISDRYWAYRVGSLLWTPLHDLATRKTPYALTLVGSTTQNGQALIQVDVVFGSYAPCQVGLGPHGSFSTAIWGAQAASFLIDPTNAVPRWIGSCASRTNLSKYDATFEFDPDFLSVGKGWAPRVVNWTGWSTFSERQEFQTIDGEWVFKKGEAWWNAADSEGRTRVIQSFELIDARIQRPALTLTRSGSNVVLALSSLGRSGIALEAAPSLAGPWSTIYAQETGEPIEASLTLPADRPARFYRWAR